MSVRSPSGTCFSRTARECEDRAAFECPECGRPLCADHATLPDCMKGRVHVRPGGEVQPSLFGDGRSA
jgi:hypothetical protein